MTFRDSNSAMSCFQSVMHICGTFDSASISRLTSFYRLPQDLKNTSIRSQCLWVLIFCCTNADQCKCSPLHTEQTSCRLFNLKSVLLSDSHFFEAIFFCVQVQIYRLRKHVPESEIDKTRCQWTRSWFPHRKVFQNAMGATDVFSETKSVDALWANPEHGICKLILQMKDESKTFFVLLFLLKYWSHWRVRKCPTIPTREAIKQLCTICGNKSGKCPATKETVKRFHKFPAVTWPAGDTVCSACFCRTGSQKVLDEKLGFVTIPHRAQKMVETVF